MNNKNLYHVNAETETHSFQCCVVAESTEEVERLVSEYANQSGLGNIDVLKLQIFLGTSDKIYVYNITKKATGE